MKAGAPKQLEYYVKEGQLPTHKWVGLKFGQKAVQKSTRRS
ncbi:MAG: hypothetical protein FD167_1 [bacterium]|nr:MAG: hypothetical protein FD167_1 [bacterium]